MPRNTTLVTWSSRYKVNVFSFWQESAASGLSLISLKSVSTGLQSTWFSSHRSKRSLHDIPPHILKFTKGNLPAVFLRVSIPALGCFSKNVAMAIAFSLCFLFFFGRMGRIEEPRDGSLFRTQTCVKLRQHLVAFETAFALMVQFQKHKSCNCSKQTHHKCLQQNHKFHERGVSDLTVLWKALRLHLLNQQDILTDLYSAFFMGNVYGFMI